MRNEEILDLTPEENALLEMKPASLCPEERKRRRQLQNRIAAQESRGRKRQYASLLENKSSSLEQQLHEATQTISELRSRVNELTSLLQRQSGMKAPYHYDPRASAQSMVTLPLSAHTSASLSSHGSALSLSPSPSSHEAMQPVDAVPSLPMMHTLQPKTEAKAVLAPMARWGFPSMSQHKLTLGSATELFTPAKTIQDLTRPTGQLLMAKLSPFTTMPQAQVPSPTPSQRSSTVPSPTLKPTPLPTRATAMASSLFRTQVGSSL
eukprot:TRINITY_DN48919_c0_g1_i1.p2 TRINITY_DN48919_c0_g1~~TRINITY_DN48919_c0_g1_i1.p2  ORF type:complete len:265 (-),score=2.18 TRINITY_DN48919_c0_g1_i1:1101-1895(-)